jgi:hypothetical protein
MFAGRERERCVDFDSVDFIFSPACQRLRSPLLDLPLLFLTFFLFLRKKKKITSAGALGRRLFEEAKNSTALSTNNGGVSSPPPFAWGVATAAYQIEGGAREGGRGVSIWDTFSKNAGDIADDFYHKYPEDIALMKKMGVNKFRMSIAWPRIVPGGTASSPVNAAGVAFYHKVIDALLEAGIEPWVTTYHWVRRSRFWGKGRKKKGGSERDAPCLSISVLKGHPRSQRAAREKEQKTKKNSKKTSKLSTTTNHQDLPQTLQDKYGGWVSPKVVDDYSRYASVVFKEYGKKVKNWSTFNEPRTFCTLGYGTGFHAPGVKSVEAAWRCTQHVLESHAAAARHFRKHVPGGRLTMNLDGEWGEPLTGSPDDAAAAQSHRDYHHGMFADPLYLGHYPESVVKHNPPGLGKISPELAKELRASMVRREEEKKRERVRERRERERGGEREREIARERG